MLKTQFFLFPNCFGSSFGFMSAITSSLIKDSKILLEENNVEVGCSISQFSVGNVLGTMVIVSFLYNFGHSPLTIQIFKI